MIDTEHFEGRWTNEDLPIASIVISSYNYGRFLVEAIVSALNQTYPNTEVIVVDDGSTDNSREIIAGYGDRIIPVLKDNGGQASAFNAGFEVSRGQVIFFLDSDDMLLPTAVEKAVKLFQDPDVAKVHWPLWIVDKRGRKTGRVMRSTLPEGDLRQTIIRDGPLTYAWPPTSGNAWARRFITSVFPVPEMMYKTWPDLYLGALAPLFGTVGKIAEPQGFWRRHGANNLGRGSFDRRLQVGLRRERYCLDMFIIYGQQTGVKPDLHSWTANSWWHQIHRAIQEIVSVIPPGEVFILANQDSWGTDEVIVGRSRIPFLERNGGYWGPPADDAAAIPELGRLHQSGASFFVFAWPHLWWLDYYTGLYNYLCSKFRCALETQRVIVFDLRS